MTDDEIPLEMVYWFFWDGVTAPKPERRRGGAFDSSFSNAFDIGELIPDDEE